MYYHDLSQKQGDYPIISAEQAEELLLAGHFYGSYHYIDEREAPFLPTEADIVKVELIYGSNEFHPFFQPFYQFTVALPEDCFEYYHNELGLKTYVQLFVPAVEGKYLAEMPFAGTFGNA